MSQFKEVFFAKHKVPEFKETVGRASWVMNGVDDKYPNYLLDLFNRSSVHNALCMGKVNYIIGNGLETDIPQLQPFLDSVNLKESANELLYKVTMDEVVFGGYFLQVVWNVNNKIGAIYHIDYSWCRVSENGKLVYVSDKFASDKRVRENDPSIKVYPAFNPSQKEGSQILFVKSYRPNLKHYALPDYLGANAAIETNIEIANYHLNNIKNGFSGGFIINFKNGQPTNEEKDAIYRDIENQHTGSDAAGRFVLIFSEGPSDAPDIIPIAQNDMDKMFEQLRKDTTEEIFIGHRITSPLLFGVKTEGQLSGSSELDIAFEIFKNTVIQPKQKGLEDTFNWLAFYATGVKADFDIQVPKPVEDVVSIKDILQDLTQDERRALKGYDPIQTTQEFSRHKKDKPKDKYDFEVFNKYGKVIDLTGYESKPIDFIGEYPVHYAFANLSSLEKKILGIITEQPNINVTEIAGATGLELDEAKEVLKRLSKQDYLWVNKADNVKITKAGETIVNNLDLPAFEIVFKYEKRPDVSGPAILPNGRTRDFCELMIKENKVYTRQEIDKISDTLGYNVWKFRGGWYTQPDGEHVPYCRHFWNQYLVAKK